MNISLFRGLSPKQADVAFTSIDSYGTPGFLNGYVMEELAYRQTRLESPSFQKLLSAKGYARMWEKGSAPIIFIVTVGGSRKVAPHLGRNLAAAFEEFADDLRDKTLWIPLMGTGSAGLSYTESMEMTMEAIRGIPEEVQPREIQISLPADIDEETITLLTGLIDQDEELDFDSLFKGFPGKIYAVGSNWGNRGDQMERFLNENTWEVGNKDKRTELIRQVAVGDLLLLKSTVANENESTFRLKAIGIVRQTAGEDFSLKVDWLWKLGKHVISGPLGRYSHRIAEMKREDFLEIVESLGRKRRIWREIFDRKSFPNEQVNYWWWKTQGLTKSEVGSEIALRLDRNAENFEHALAAKEGDLVLGYRAEKENAVLFALEAVANKSDDEFAVLVLRVKELIQPKIPFAEISLLPALQGSPILINAETNFYPLTKDQYDAIRGIEVQRTPDNSFAIASRIAGLKSDSEEGEDYFGIHKDVEAFAKVITAKSFTPPLAIALFGKWGTGKSFFMHKLKQRITELTKTEEASVQPTYCKGVAHIHFNAWSYLDANLWASLVTRIFEGLNEYIGENTASQKHKEEVERRLQEELNVIREERNAMELKKENAKSEKDRLKGNRDTAKDKLQEQIDAINNKTWESVLAKIDEKYKVHEKLTNALKNNKHLHALQSRIDVLVPTEHRHNPDLVLHELKSARAFLREFMRDRSAQRWLIGGLLIAGAILIIPAVIPEIAAFLQDGFAWLPQIALSAAAVITPIWKGYTKIYDVLRPIIAEAWKVKKEYDTQVEAARFSHEQEMEARKLQIEQLKGEIAQLDIRMEELDKEVRELEFKLSHGLATQTLYSFIEKRASSEEYKKHLGIVSTIRNDFRILSELFHDSSAEEGQAGDEFHKYFTTPLQRIVLYVDDLDRCPENRVIEVLEAVNLLMAFPLFVVVVGVDPRWVKNALLEKYRKQFGDDKAEGHQRIEAANYLEKIFQVPFHLRQADDKDVKHMLNKLTEKSVRVEEVVPGQKTTSNADNSDSEAPAQQNTQGEKIYSVNTGKKQSDQAEERLELYPEEVELMQDISLILGNNPRAIKRFVNVYQIARAHEGLTIGDRKPESFLSIMLLLALPIGPYKHLHADFVAYLSKTQLDKSGNLNAYLTEYKLLETDAEVHYHRTELNAVMKTLANEKLLRQLKSSDLLRHNNFVQRFTFSEMIE